MHIKEMIIPDPHPVMQKLFSQIPDVFFEMILEPCYIPTIMLPLSRLPKGQTKVVPITDLIVELPDPLHTDSSFRCLSFAVLGALLK